MGPGESGAAQVLTGKGESCPLPHSTSKLAAPLGKLAFQRVGCFQKRFRTTVLLHFTLSVLWEMEKQKHDTSDTTKVTEGGGLMK